MSRLSSLRLPVVATAPFCPSEVQGTVALPPAIPDWKRLLRFLGPGVLISVGYMDPGNWATDLDAGARYGEQLLSVVVLSSLAGMVLQTLAARLGIATGKDLALLCRERYPAAVGRVLWIAAEIAIVACDVAEVLGSALALQLLFHLPLWAGVCVTGLDVVLVLGLKGRGFRQLEAIVFGLVLTIAAAFTIELILSPPDPKAAMLGLLPGLDLLRDPHRLYIAIGILGATVMPHNLYLHSSVVQTREVRTNPAGRREAIRFSTIDIIASLAAAMAVNMAILMLAASAFHGRAGAGDITEAYKLLGPLVGPTAALVFGIALLASGQSSTFTGTIAGQVVMEGFLDLQIPCWQRRLITRALALLPALLGVLAWGEGSVGRLLVFSQVVLSLQLPFALYPLLRFTGDRGLMGEFANRAPLKLLAWGLFAVISAANVWLMVGAASGGG